MNTEQIYYQDVYCRSFEAVIEEIKKTDDELWVRLNRTAFYPEGGGQPCDLGILWWSRPQEDWKYTAEVLDVQERDKEIWHRLGSIQTRETGQSEDSLTDEMKLTAAADLTTVTGLTGVTGSEDKKDVAAEFAVGMAVHGELSWQRRLDLMQQHSGEHIVSGLIHNRFGYDNVGFHLPMDSMTLDLSGELTWDELMEIEAGANELVRADLPIQITYPSAEELNDLPYRSKKELTGEVRIVTVPGGDICACCGTHVGRTGEIGLIKIVSMQKWKAGVRVWMCCGRRAEEYCRMVHNQNRQISVALSAKLEETAAAVERVEAELAALKQQLTGWKYRLYGEIAGRFAGQQEAVLFEDNLSMDDLRHLTDRLMDVCTGTCFVFSGRDGEGYRYAVGHRGGDVRALIKEMNRALTGRGGGKNEMAQGTLQASKAEIEAWVRNCGDECCGQG